MERPFKYTLPVPPRDEVAGTWETKPLGNGKNGAVKLRGGYYTPRPIASFLASWCVRTPDARVLEPSAGDGVLVKEAASRLGDRGEVVAIEVDGPEAAAISGLNCRNTKVVQVDFFDWYRVKKPDSSFDCVVGNPPFIRYHDFPEEHREPAFQLMREVGLRPTRLTNAWVPFVVLATRALKPGGRLALVLPAELLQVGYAAEIREYLAKHYSRLTVITFRSLVFDEIQQETILLLGERGDCVGAQMSFVELGGAPDLSTIEDVLGAGSVSVDLDHAREKWTQFYLTPRELELVRAIEQGSWARRLGEYAEVDVGVVTGRNDYFVFTERRALEEGISQFCIRMVGRSSQIPGLVLSESDWQRLSRVGEKCLLLSLGGVAEGRLLGSVAQYIRRGEEAGIPTGYKCKVRMPRWWNVPSVWVPDAFLLRQIHDGPRIVVNDAGATCTDTVHRVRLRNGFDARWLAGASVNSLIFAFAEIRGRSYGGGVLELEPSEAESLPFPPPSAGSVRLDQLDELARTKGIEAVLDVGDECVLIASGLTRSEIRTLREIWQKLYDRRRRRRRRQTAWGGNPLYRLV